MTTEPNIPQTTSATEPVGEADFKTGVAHHLNGQLDAAAAAYSRAIALNNQHPYAIHNLATIILGLGHRERAIGLFQLATVIKPDYSEAYVNWGLLLNQDGHSEVAIEKFEKAIELDGNNSSARLQLADIHRVQQRYELALEGYRAVLAITPQSIEAHNNMGISYRRLDLDEKAFKCFERALAINPEFVDALVNSANCLDEYDLQDEAIARLQRALEINPNVAAIYNNLGIALTKVGRYPEALEVLEKAITMSDGSVDVVSNFANTLNKSGKTVEAVETYNTLLSDNEDHYGAYNNLGNALKDMARYEEAREMFRKSTQINPEFAHAHANLGYVQLLLGEFSEGWVEYGWRGIIKGSKLARRTYNPPPWQGEKLAGKTIYVYPEQGLGDIVQFARYAVMLKDLGARVIMEVPLNLRDLFPQLPGIDGLNLKDTPPPPFDYHVSIMDLPEHFKTTLETIPCPKRYLTVDAERDNQWSERMQGDGKFRVGIIWAGNPEHTNDRNRSLALSQIRPLVELQGVTVYSLQVGKDGEAHQMYGEKIIDLAPQLTNFAETAGAMNHLDLIISVDTSPLHVAGALGRPVWGLIPYIPDWRWLLDRDDSPWYPSLQLFRQGEDRRWEPVIARIVTAVKEKL